MDFRWDNGFITGKTEYLEKRLKLQQQLERLTPVREEMDVAVDLLSNFAEHFTHCEGDVARQHDLLRLIVERIYVNNGHVVALTMKADYHVLLGNTAGDAPTLDIQPIVSEWALRDSNP